MSTEEIFRLAAERDGRSSSATAVLFGLQVRQFGTGTKCGGLRSDLRPADCPVVQSRQTGARETDREGLRVSRATKGGCALSGPHASAFRATIVSYPETATPDI